MMMIIWCNNGIKNQTTWTTKNRSAESFWYTKTTTEKKGFSSKGKSKLPSGTDRMRYIYFHYDVRNEETRFIWL